MTPRAKNPMLAAVPIALIRVYQATLGPFMRGQCRFHPSCSNYAIDAYRTHGVFRATWLTARRLARCHPLTRGGYDPVPPPELPESPPNAPPQAHPGPPRD